MMRKKKVLILFSFMIFFLLGFTLKINTSADGEVKVVKHLTNGKISHLEVITHRNIQNITLQAFNEQGEMSHLLLLEDYIVTQNPHLNRNSFYITNRIAGLEDIYELFLINGGNIKIPIEIKEIEATEEVVMAERLVASQAMENILSESSVDTLKIMSYNIHHGRNLFGRYSLDEIAEVIKNSNADIIGLQEVDNGVVRSRFQDQLKYLSEKLSMEYAYGHNYNVLGGMYGNGVLSKYPIESYENLRLPSGREQRGLLNAIINIEGKQLSFLVTHLGLNEQERQRQVKAVSNYLDTLTNQVILVGDFNTRSNSEEIKLLSKRLIDAAYAMDNIEPTFDLSVLSGRIDYIFLDQSMDIRNYRVIKSRASDHYPITATFELE
ncbi:Metal-dependent hydrolase, endonuclease/exonuclease/phosphatase family [Anaerovirgula multivorans]|uniref:Metal-dependent hydrolase, endonuclease/exonuclease/phosphatase family n=1 Tax=Anaerovirgula multivorans TaxID=312168 RepID=A0A239KCP7_9FIRM|nr:endonuclease/exonuclease/phosphatase family protein [Anaerovirgula multivorans]SNT14894.1 Metal-dependent hydrolase, endonuclease/exonuclease/phosphatase family [Anaerovirgula multivorans]